MNFNIIPKMPKWEFKNIRKIWKTELLAAGILLILFLGWDLWIYLKMASAESNLPVITDGAKVLAFKRDRLEAIDKKLREYREFLKNPKFTF